MEESLRVRIIFQCPFHVERKLIYNLKAHTHSLAPAMTGVDCPQRLQLLIKGQRTIYYEIK